MPALIDIRRRIRSVKNTQQITKALKMVSAAKLRRAQESMFAARPYARTMAHEISHFLGRYSKLDGTYKGFDDLHSDADLLMHQGGSGWKISLEHCLNYFNPGY